MPKPLMKVKVVKGHSKKQKAIAIAAVTAAIATAAYLGRHKIERGAFRYKRKVDRLLSARKK